MREDIVPALHRLRLLGNLLYSLGPRGIERVVTCPPARFTVRRMGWWERSSEIEGTLSVEKATRYHPEQ
ncbi:MAG: hypothetical protein GF400_00210 [Candidatus Eisenbacteria bacterium]|nr:hypothetical protein [Candidatus Eisenbacteria bacterium]